MNMRRKDRIIVLILLIALLGAGCSPKVKKDNEETKEDKSIPVELGKVELGSIYNKAILSGRALSEKDAMVIPEIPGKVKDINTSVGNTVKKGDLLFTIENKEIDNQIKDLDSTLTNLQGKKSDLEGEMEKQKAQLTAVSPGETTIPSMKGTLVPPKTEPSMDTSMIQELDAQIGEVSKGLEQAKEAKEKLKVKSPIEGTVSLISIKEDGVAMQEEPSMIVSDLNNMYIELNVTEGILNKIKVGDKVKIDIPSLSKEGMDGKINFISIMPNMKNGLYTVRVSIDDKNLSLKPGILGKVYFELDRLDNVIVLNSNVVIDRNGEKLVYLVKDGKAVERTVTIGMDTGELVEITKGLKEGEEIIIKGQNFLKNGDKVKVVRGDR
jgi:multidrug efflux pump subunit AcrA (membrane-fusion protein)